MVVADEYEGADAFRCEECGMHYRDRATAARCEDYCRSQGGCSSDITTDSLERADEI